MLSAECERGESAQAFVALALFGGHHGEPQLRVVLTPSIFDYLKRGSEKVVCCCDHGITVARHVRLFNVGRVGHGRVPCPMFELSK